MSITEQRVLTGPRWSSAVKCPRRAVYEGLDIEREPLTPEQIALFRRGRYIGAAIAADIEADLIAQGRPAGIAEREVAWPADDPVGVGHADYFIADVGTIIEVVSTAGCELPKHKAIQAAGYAINEPLAGGATVLSVDPSTFAEQAYPLDLDGLVDDVWEIQRAVLSGIRDGEIPRRAMRQNGIEEVEGPNEWPCFDCPFRRTCWKEWEPWPTSSLPESLAAKVERLAHLEDYLAVTKKAPAEEAERAALRAEIRARMEPQITYVCAGISVRFTQVEHSRRFSLRDAETAGHRLPEHLEAFVTESGGHERWFLRRLNT